MKNLLKKIEHANNILEKKFISNLYFDHVFLEKKDDQIILVFKNATRKFDKICEKAVKQIEKGGWVFRACNVQFDLEEKLEKRAIKYIDHLNIEISCKEMDY